MNFNFYYLKSQLLNQVSRELQNIEFCRRIAAVSGTFSTHHNSTALHCIFGLTGT